MYRLNKALFLDLDGTIVKPKDGKTFPDTPDDFLFLEGILPFIKEYNDIGYYICIVSNQAGISQGFITHEFMEERLDLISKEIEEYIGRGINYMYCANYGCYDRKPNPGMVYTMALQLELDLRESVMVGNSQDDYDLMKVSGIGKFYWINDILN